MELTMEATNTKQISHYAPRKITIDGQIYQASLIISKDTLIHPWAPKSLEDLTVAHCNAILNLKPDIVIMGTGEKQGFLTPTLMAFFMERRISPEIMTTGSAARTFNVLAAEDRNVVAALLMD